MGGGCLLCAFLWSIYFGFIFSIPLLFIVLIVRTRERKEKGTIGLFHPYCNAGGGGERVLWCAINAMQKEYANKDIRFIVYTGDIDAKPNEILAKAMSRFNIPLNEQNLHFVYLRTRPWLEAKNYKHFTLLLQTLAALIVGIEALCSVNPEVFIDTMGYPLTLPLFRWIGGCRIACYVHYPTISTDMIRSVESRESSYNNAEWIAGNRLFSIAKLIYYRIFAFFYSLCGKCAQIVMVNGSWTQNHIVELWRVPERTFIVYPPCNVDVFLRLSNDSERLLNDHKYVQLLSVGQIRPEKDHRLQICIFAELKKTLIANNSKHSVRLTICGGCRHDEDNKRVIELQQYAKQLGLDDEDIEWALNVPIERLCSLMKESLIGLHTMRNEHFGISVVEGIAAGQIMIAHDSGGPKLDILTAAAAAAATTTTHDEEHRIGFLATSIQDYVNCIVNVLEMTMDERERIRKNGRNAIAKFSDSNFALKWNATIAKLIITS